MHDLGGDRTFTKRGEGADRDRVENEARHLKAVAGPGVVPLRRISRKGDSITLELSAASCSLADVLHERGHLPEGEVRAVAVAAASALVRIHDAGVVHGDIKPANMLLTGTGELWLADLDAACMADGTPLTRGTPGRLRVRAVASPATDVISLGITVIELATGILADTALEWSRADLENLGCSSDLAAELEVVLRAPSPPPAQDLVSMFQRATGLSLPAPARHVRGVDPTPTIDFMPVGPLELAAEPAEDQTLDPTTVIATVITVISLIVAVALVLF